MWDLIINPFTTLLTLLYSVFDGNIVLAIVVFTVLVRLLTYPLTVQQQRSAKAMQELQPKLKKLQEKYKNDREKLAQAQMQLYREHGVSPFGGCLPLLIQLPILLALYQAIIHALAGTPFQLIDLADRLLVPGLDLLVPLHNTWLGMDLTLPPTPPANPPIALALPVLVLVTTWLQSKLTMPAPPPKKEKDAKPDQTQAMTQSMTTIMPIMFGFFALSFSVGISVYFIVSNLIGIAQYSLMGKVNVRNLLGGAARQVEPVTSSVGVNPGDGDLHKEEKLDGEKGFDPWASPESKTPAKERSRPRPKAKKKARSK